MTLKEKIEKIEELFPGKRFAPGTAINEDGALNLSDNHGSFQYEWEKNNVDDILFLGTLRVPNTLPVEYFSKLKECAEVLGAEIFQVGNRDFEVTAIHFYYVPTKLEIQEAKIAKVKSQLSDLEKELAELKTNEKCTSAPTV